MCPPTFMFCESKTQSVLCFWKQIMCLLATKYSLKPWEPGPSTQGLAVPLCSCLQMGMQTATSQSQFLPLKHRDCQSNVLREHLLLAESFLYLSFTWSLRAGCLQSLSKLESIEISQVNDLSFLKRKLRPSPSDRPGLKARVQLPAHVCHCVSHST